MTTTTDFLSTRIYRPNQFVAERELAYYISRFVKAKCKPITPLTDTLLHKQPQAVEMACTKPISILTGPPGTGKTTTLKQIVCSFLASGLRGRIVGPTGKSAVRADEVVNVGRNFVAKVPCTTIHTALQWSMLEGGFTYNRTHRLPDDYLILEEFSMPDIELYRDTFEAINPFRTRVLLCGDQHQIPSIGPGNVARDLIECGRIPTTELDVVLRTGENSGVTYNANLILRGEEISKTDSDGVAFKDFYMVGKATELETTNAIIKWVSEEIPARLGFKHADIQVLCAGKEGLSGTKNLNRLLRDALNNVDEKKVAKLNGFRVGDKVINNVNLKQFNIVNGSIGNVKDVVSGQSGSHIIIDFGPGCGKDGTGIVELRSTETISLAYALTVHKSQGSEFPVVIMPLHRTHMRLMSRAIVYTGITRARQLGMFCGDYEVLRYATKNIQNVNRKTKLQELIQMCVPEVHNV